MEPYILTTYILVGIGILGAAHRWTHVGWAWYSVFFPAHAILISISHSFYQCVKSILKVEKVRTVILFIAVILFTWGVLCCGSSQ